MRESRAFTYPLRAAQRMHMLCPMHAASAPAAKIALKHRAGPHEQFAATNAAKPTAGSASLRYVASDSEPEPTEPDIPLEKAWFKDRPDIIEGIKRGLADMDAGRIELLDPFEGYEGELDD